MNAPPPHAPRARLVRVAAASPGALADATSALADGLDALDGLAPDHLGPWLADHEALTGPYRLAVVADAPGPAARALRDALEDHRRRDPRPRFSPPEIAFVFPGQGVQRPGMGLELLPLAPFAAALAALDAPLRPHLGAPLAEVLAGCGPRDLDDTAITQPATVALSIALSQTLITLGVTPTAALGHSVGELGAAWLAGCLPLDRALSLVVIRSALMAALPERGQMALLRAGETEVRALLALGAEIAALNGPGATVISGPAAAVAATVARAAHLRARALPISQASHCALLDPMLDAFERAAAAHDDATRPPAIVLASSLHGALFGHGPAPDRPNAAYWRRHAREPVRFEAAAHALADRGVEVFIELAPEPALSRLALTPHATWLGTLDPKRPPLVPLLELLAELFRRGAALELTSLAT